MNSIPKELQGTKAVPFLEWDIQRSHLIGLGTVDSMRQSSADKAEVREFYSQPFTPEMIMEYFEECNKETNTIDTFYEFYPASIWFGGTNMYIAKNEQSDGYGFYIPQTLNDFISDCNRAEINDLTFKKQ